MARTGRPTKYKRKYCEEIIEFFNVEPFVYEEVLVNKRDGTSSSKVERYPAKLPTAERFAHNIGVHTDTLNEWQTKYPEFSVAYKKAHQLQKDILVTNGLQGLYPSNFAIFVAQNFTDMKDKKDINLGGELNVALVEFVGEDGPSQDSTT